jgi:hypothetical protein
MRPIRRKLAGTKKRLYTFNVSVNFNVQFTFTEKEIEQSEEGWENDVDPTEKALANLEQEITECLSKEYYVSEVEAFADFESLLGISEDEDLRSSKNSRMTKVSLSRNSGGRQ